MNTQTFHFIRHGERADLSGNPLEKSEIKLKFDPHLTELGKKQAKSTGEFLAQKYKNDSNPIFIVSSPFLRCLQTADIILDQIKINSKNLVEKIIINEDFCEILSSDLFEKNELPNLTIYKEKKILKQSN